MTAADRSNDPGDRASGGVLDQGEEIAGTVLVREDDSPEESGRRTAREPSSLTEPRGNGVSRLLIHWSRLVIAVSKQTLHGCPSPRLGEGVTAQ